MTTTNDRVEITPELLGVIETAGKALLDGSRDPALYSANALAYNRAVNRYTVLALVSRIRELESERDRLTAQNPPEAWHDDDGTALWWLGDDLMYVGSPLDTGWPGDEEFDFWTRIPNPCSGVMFP